MCFQDNPLSVFFGNNCDALYACDEVASVDGQLAVVGLRNHTLVVRKLTINQLGDHRCRIDPETTIQASNRCRIRVFVIRSLPKLKARLSICKNDLNCIVISCETQNFIHGAGRNDGIASSIAACNLSLGNCEAVRIRRNKLDRRTIEFKEHTRKNDARFICRNREVDFLNQRLEEATGDCKGSDVINFRRCGKLIG